MVTGQPSTDWAGRRIPLNEAVVCAKCIGAPWCGEIGTEYQCDPLNVPTHVAHPSNPLSLGRLSALGTLDLDVVALPQPHPKLPGFIPIVEPRGVGSAVHEAFVAVTLKDAFHRSGSAAKALTLRRRLRANSDSFVVLLSFGADPLVIRGTEAGESMVRAIAAGDFDLVTAVGLSYYRTDPPLENLLNMRESLETFRQLQAHGVNAVPVVSFCNERDVRRWATWLTNNPAVRTVALDFQDARYGRDWRFVLGGFRELAHASPADIHYLIRGPTGPGRIRSLFTVTRRLTIVNAQPFMKATKGASLVQRRRRRSKMALFREWSRCYKQRCKAVTLD